MVKHNWLLVSKTSEDVAFTGTWDEVNAEATKLNIKQIEQLDSYGA